MNRRRIQKERANFDFGESINDGIQNMSGLVIVVLLHGHLPPGVIVRVRHHKHLELLRVPLVPPVLHLPPLLPRPAINIRELDPVVQILGGDVDGGEVGGGRAAWAARTAEEEGEECDERGGGGGRAGSGGGARRRRGGREGGAGSSI